MFSPPTFVTIGDEYDKRGSRGPKSGRAHVPAFVIPTKRKPHLIDSVFGPLNPLSMGDPYHESTATAMIQDAATHTNTNTTTPHKSDTRKYQPPFRPAGRSHKSSTKGDYYGTFSEKNPPTHETELPLITRRPGYGNKDALKPMQSRNFYTNPAKKGTYGYTGLTIGKAGEVCYVSDSYDAAAAGDARSAELLKKRAAAVAQGSGSGSPSVLGTSRPFRSAVPHGGCFDDSEHGFTRVYSLSKPLPARKTTMTALAHADSTATGRRGGQQGGTTAAGRPWVPAGTLTSDITKYPEYQEDPYDIKEHKVRQENMKERQYKAWHPTGSDPNRYIYTKPIDFIPPPVV